MTAPSFLMMRRQCTVISTLPHFDTNNNGNRLAGFDEAVVLLVNPIRGVWYTSFVAMDYVTNASTSGRSISTLLSVYTESGCQELACIAQELACIAASDDGGLI
jgi:hypothetical protein